MDRADMPLRSLNNPWDPMDPAFWLRELRAGCDDLDVKWTAIEAGKRERQSRWLAVFARTGAPSRANGAAEVTRKTSAMWTNECSIFGPLRDYAKEALAERFIAEMVRRSVEGVTVEIRNSRTGEVVGEEIKYSDTMLIHLTKGLDSEKRWAKRVDAAAPSEETWRNLLVRIKDDPDALAALDVLADKLHEG